VGPGILLISFELIRLLINGGIAFGLYGLFSLPMVHAAGIDTLLWVAAKGTVFLVGGIFATEAGHIDRKRKHKRGG
jgi:hypothetical protein